MSMVSNETSSALSRIAGWNALLGISVLFVLNELLPVIFGSGKNAAWDWSFVFVTLRFIIVPVASVLYLGANVALAMKEKRFTASIALRCIGAAALVALCWVRQGPTFGT
jgi:hypothetical protein